MQSTSSIRLAGRIVAAAAIALSLSGCGGVSNSLSGSNLPFLARSSTATSAMAERTNPANCSAAPSVWASSGGPTALVVGYNSSGVACVTLTGANGITFLQTSGLTTDLQGYLYVADTFRDRVVVFDKHGNYWSTLNVPNHAPIGVCTNHKGYVVGVVTNNPTGSNIDFFAGKGAQNSSSNPTNYTVGYPYSNRFCAFDAAGDFFATGSAAPAPISYLRYNSVNVPNATIQICTTSVCNGSTHSWFGPYVHINSSAAVLSVGDLNGPNIVNLQIGQSPPNLLTFTAWAAQPTTALTGYAGTFGCGMAPTSGTGSSSRIYIACGANSAVDFVSNTLTGGTVNVFATLGNSYGVATYPTGVY